MANPPLDLATYLAGQGLGLTLQTNLFWSLQLAESDQAGVPSDAVFIYSMPGGPPDRNNDTRIEHRFPIVHIRIRNRRHATVDSLARAIMQKLQGANLGGDYLDLRALQSDPITSFDPKSGLHQISIAYEAVYESDIR